MGPTACMTKRALRFPPMVKTAPPVGQRPIFLHSSFILCPPALCMAPSTPPPPESLVFAALTMASVSSTVISPLISEIVVESTLTSMTHLLFPGKTFCKKFSPDPFQKLLAIPWMETPPPPPGAKIAREGGSHQGVINERLLKGGSGGDL